MTKLKKLKLKFQWCLFKFTEARGAIGWISCFKDYGMVQKKWFWYRWEYRYGYISKTYINWQRKDNEKYLVKINNLFLRSKNILNSKRLEEAKIMKSKKCWQVHRCRKTSWFGFMVDSEGQILYLVQSPTGSGKRPRDKLSDRTPFLFYVWTRKPEKIIAIIWLFTNWQAASKNAR